MLLHCNNSDSLLRVGGCEKNCEHSHLSIISSSADICGKLSEATVPLWRLRTQQHAMPSTQPHAATSMTAVKLGMQQVYPGPLHGSMPHRAMRAAHRIAGV